MENNVDALLTRLIENLTDSYNHTNNNPQSSNTREAPSEISLLNRQLDILSNFSVLYNYNQIEYQRNTNQMMTLLLSNMRETHALRQRTPAFNPPHSRANTTRHVHNTRRNTHRTQPVYNNNNNNNNNNNHIWNNNIRNNTERWNGFGNSNNRWNDELRNILNTYINQNDENERRLNTIEIENSTRTFTFTQTTSNELRDIQCPISLEPFIEGDVLCEINSCRHVFRRDNLIRWLRRSNCCPVCRFNMLTQSNEPPTEPPGTNITNVNNNINNNNTGIADSYLYTWTTTLPLDNSYNYTPIVDQSNVTVTVNSDVSNNYTPENPPVD
jgi:hypothetical protein